MNVLAFDTASPNPSVALLFDGRLFEQRLPGDRRSSEELLPAVARLMADAGAGLENCDRIAVCAGPGSFTGLRIGLATAWSFGRALGIAVESVSTLEAIAEASRSSGRARLQAVLDAGRGEVIVEEFSLEGPRARSLAPARRVATAAFAGEEASDAVFGVPASIAGPWGQAPPQPIASALALAVARHPGAASGALPVPAYARASAAEEKHGSS
jgi:tRNA threonylcarbamoyladenosine biosynthesis protein TsaB